MHLHTCTYVYMYACVCVFADTSIQVWMSHQSSGLCANIERGLLKKQRNAKSVLEFLPRSLKTPKTAAS